MNKKFSTLAASLLLASAFSAMAAPSSIAVSDLKAGDIVRLKFNNSGDKFISVEKSELTPTTEITYSSDVENPYTTYFNKQNAQLWKVAKVTKTSTGDKTFQFVNKLTGEYLALDLATNDTGHKTKDPVKLNPAGNREWAFDGSGMYAYSSSKDSIFYLDNDMYLHSAENANSALQVTLDNTELPYVLPVDGFNKLMALTGHNAMLNFNNSKDVTSTQTNILKNTKWQAVGTEGTSTTLYLTNGETTDGAKFKDDTWSKVKKKMYLQIDTAYYDETTPNYFKFDVDTLNREVGVDEADKPIMKHPNELGQFEATYYFNNDSIAISAKYLPKKKTISQAREASYSVELSNVAVAFTNAINNVAKSVAIKKAIDRINTDIDTWKTSAAVTGAAVGASVNANISTEELSSAVALPGTFAETANVNKIKGEVESIKFTQAGYTVDGTHYTTAKEGIATALGSGTGANANSIKDLEAVMTAWTSATFTSEASFLTTSFTANGTSGSLTNVAVDASGTSSMTGQVYLALATAESSFETEMGASYKSVAEKLAFKPAVFSATINGEEKKDAGLENLTFTTIEENRFFAETTSGALASLQTAFNMYVAGNGSVNTQFSNIRFTIAENGSVSMGTGTVASELLIKPVSDANTMEIADDEVSTLTEMLGGITYTAAAPGTTRTAPYFWMKEGGEFGADNSFGLTDAGSYPVVLRSLADVTVLTVAADGASIAEPKGYILPLIQPYATSGGDATDIATAAKVYNLQIQNVAKNYTPLRANKLTGTYLVAKSKTEAAQVDDVDASNVYAQWAFIPGTAGYYSIVNRAIPELVYYTGPVSKVKDADNKVVADTYVLGTDTLKIAGVTLNEDNFYTEKVDDKNVQYDYSGTYYTGKLDGITQSYTINPVSPFLSTLSAQMNKDSVLVLGAAEDGLVWHVKKADAMTYGLEIAGLPQLKKEVYNIYTIDGDDNEYYIEQSDNVYILKHKETKDANPAEFEIRNVAEGQYNFIEINTTTGAAVKKMTINATPAKPIIEASDVTLEKNDLFALNKTQLNKYRKLTAEDGVLGNAKIYMENEPNRYLYENTANIVANNGNKIAKDSLNFLGIYNTAAMEKNAALFVDTAYVEREGVYMPQYMFALNVTNVPAHEAIACTYEHNHFDNAGNKVDALHCSHATPATLGYKSGRYLVALTDSIEGVSKHPGRYDGETRLAFVEAIHRNAEDSLIIKNSKWTGNSKQIVAGKEDTYASYDTLKIEDNKLKTMTFALEIADQSTQSFYLATSGNKYVRILNGVPVLTGKKDDAAIFNIEATTEEATANEAIEASAVQVIAGKGVVTVQGAAGKVITVANILGQTIANQVAASDNVTIAAPAGVVVVTVDGEATKVVVK